MNPCSLLARRFSLIAFCVLALAICGGHTFAQTTAAAQKTSKISLDLNKASIYDLEQLPGIGGEYARKIIDGRPYRTKADLLSRRIIPPATYRQIAPEVFTKISAVGPARCED